MSTVLIRSSARRVSRSRVPARRGGAAAPLPASCTAPAPAAAAPAVKTEVRRGVCVLVQDVTAATWPDCRRLLAALDTLATVPVTLLVAPDARGALDADAAFISGLEQRLARGDEIALQGFRTQEPTRPAGLFSWLCPPAAGLAREPYAQAYGRLERALNSMRQLGWPVRGFAAPGGPLSRGMGLALCQLPFTYVSSGEGLRRLPDWHAVAVRDLAGGRLPWLATLGALDLRLGWRTPHAPILSRCVLRPADARQPVALSGLQQLLAQGHTPVTQVGWVQTLPTRLPGGLAGTTRPLVY